jgi:SAM-dependent methyltransferase
MFDVSEKKVATIRAAPAKKVPTRKATTAKGSKKIVASVAKNVAVKKIAVKTIKKISAIKIPVPTTPATPAPVPVMSNTSNKYAGDGTHIYPLKQILNVDPNESDCMYCATSTCPCNDFSTILEDTFSTVSRKRITSTNKKQMCAKSILPPFVSRLVDVLSITKDDTFYDLGCGNGSVLFQIAYMTGAKCVGVELSEHNAQLAREAWEVVRPQLEKMSGRKMPEIEIITGDLTAVIAQPRFQSRNTVVWTANLLMPKMLTQHMAERFRQLPVGSRIACFDDMFPHSRSIARIRDPEAFELFEMVDHTWAPSTVEWTFYEGPFYSYIRK